DARIAAIAAEAVKESRYHLKRSREWVLCLGGGTKESQGRIQRAFDALWGYGPEMSELDRHEKALLESGVSVDRSAMKADWQASMTDLLVEAGLKVPEQEWSINGGREGVHTEHHGYLLAEMQSMQRAYPGLAW
ncbi:MAG: phenylacetate-CoA oxygenase subunit PaaI, partial [Gammaproteobacteria bacterium]|nr:phenylacetate-CoA oxygenase subunit PaaI [Gammaproteobacteria bacterium]